MFKEGGEFNMAVYGRLKIKSKSGKMDHFYPKSYASLIYMSNDTTKTVQSRIEDIISGTQQVGDSKKADHAKNADQSANSTKWANYSIAIREKGYTPNEGDYTNTIVMIEQ